MNKITVQVIINSDIKTVWDTWVSAAEVSNWCFAHESWGSLCVVNDVKVSGRFKTNMFAKDGSAAFDFEGMYTEVVSMERLVYVMYDGRQVEVLFKDLGNNQTGVVETFDPESINSTEMQKNGWQSILDNFKKYVETKKPL